MNSDDFFSFYQIIGTGRVARHMAHYLSLLNLPFKATPPSNARSPRDPLVKNPEASHILLAVQDSAIESVYQQLRQQTSTQAFPVTYVHFSGLLQLSDVHFAHPLMTFGQSLFDLNFYKQIPFAIAPNARFNQILPGLSNPVFHVREEQRGLYHALCTLAGNLAHLEWSEVRKTWQEQLHLSPELMKPYLNQVVENIWSELNTPSALTGPVARQDWITVKAHLRHLEKNPSLKKTYSFFIQKAQQAGAEIPSEVHL